MTTDPDGPAAGAAHDVLRRGRFKVYLGYAAGTGKTYQMLDEGQELLRRGVDVLVGYFETHGRRDTIAKAEGLETVPRRKISYRGTEFAEMDADAILVRKPAVCLVDELAHTNVPGSDRAKRWQDVQILLDAGIDVVTTVNVQHLESLNDEIRQITGVRVRETVPDWVVNEADEVILVDVTPRALQNRLKRGVVYPIEKAQRAMENFFTEPNLAALRELALRQAAHEVEDRLERAEVEDPALPGAGGSRDAGPSHPGHAHPKRHGCVMICLSGSPAIAASLIRRGKRVADFLQTDCVAVHVEQEQAASGVSSGPKGAVEPLMALAENLHIETRTLYGKDVARALVDFARSRGVTHLFLGRTHESGWRRWLAGSIIDRVVRLAPDLQITIVAR